jgi:N-acetyl-anhydromuramyl-L-alanine amidase AmpD
MARRTKSKARRKAPVSRRSGVVWTALIGAMTSVGGLLWALDSRAGADNGVTLPALVATTTPTSNPIGVIFNTTSPLDRQRWQSIVIHDSGSSYGTPASIEAQQRQANIQGLGFHFVIGNGNGTRAGELHVGNRWLLQQPGAHAVGARAEQMNLRGIGICLVGNGEKSEFPDAEIDRLVELVAALCQELNIPRDRVFLQSDIARVASPGRLFPEALFWERLAAATRGR